MSLFVTVTLISFALYTFSGYIKIALIAMRMPGPFAYPIIGNTYLATERNGESWSKI
jgi:hypothetical protein